MGNLTMTGVVLGTGSAINVLKEKCGFRPKRVELENKAGVVKAVWTDQMADGHMQKIVDSGAGTTDVADVTANGITPKDDGFTIGTDGDLNASGEAIFYTATG